MKEPDQGLELAVAIKFGDTLLRSLMAMRDATAATGAPSAGVLVTVIGAAIEKAKTDGELAARAYLARAKVPDPDKQRVAFLTILAGGLEKGLTSLVEGVRAHGAPDAVTLVQHCQDAIEGAKADAARAAHVA